MISRTLLPELLKLLTFYPAVGLVGARQVGKTTLAQSLSGQVGKPIRYFDLERLEDLQRLTSDPGFFLEQFREELVVIDEVQRLPALFAELRSLIDRHRTPGRFLLLGSASPLLLRNTADTLAGRIGFLTMHPLLLSEIGLEQGNIMRHWWRGGFPDAWQAPTDELSFHWRESFTRTYVERDLQFLGFNADPIRFRTFLQMLASVHGSLWNAESLGRSLGLSGNTVKHYLGFLESSFFVRVLPPFFTNISKRLVKSPKIYLTDTGLLHVLLGIRQQSDLTLHPMAGPSWEGYVLSQIIATLPKGVEPFFFRTSDGTECDLVLVDGLKPLACIEVKLGNVANVAKGFRNTVETLQTPINFILTFDSDDYFINKNMRVMGFLHFIRQLPGILSQ
ncbi:MAG: hypothetical protein KIPDCIKN_04148 [Haliscomenobacter sp.]|jgi:predicted AAA+ superfamily ATPase|nr:hypothetical protein [Haliscomenobacter sp.]